MNDLGALVGRLNLDRRMSHRVPLTKPEVTTFMVKDVFVSDGL
jgi:hypothetical protein